MLVTQVEPAVRAANGHIVVSREDGQPKRYTVTRGPVNIAQRLHWSVEAGEPVFRYHDRPGERESRLVEIPCRGITAICVEYDEADLDALTTSWASRPVAART